MKEAPAPSRNQYTSRNTSLITSYGD